MLKKFTEFSKRLLQGFFVMKGKKFGIAYISSMFIPKDDTRKIFSKYILVGLIFVLCGVLVSHLKFKTSEY